MKAFRALETQSPVKLHLVFGCAALALISSLYSPPDVRPPDARDRADTTFFLPDDLEITLWAEAPQLFNPTNIDVDARGRVWVTEAVNYRDFNNAPEDHLHRAGGDRVVILEDTDGDGQADSSKTFIQDESLRAPLGIAVLGDRVIVSSSPHIIAYTDSDNDDVPDHKEILLDGFGGYDHDHGLHSLVAGPDGRWYFNAGNAGPHVVTDRAGWTLRSGSLYHGGTPYNTANESGLLSDDGRLWTGGLALRIEPDGTGLEVLAHNFRNAYEFAVDSQGNLWQNDNDDEVLACRTSWVMEGANMGYFSADGSRTWQADRRPGQETFTAHWHQEDPGVLPAGDHTGAGSPTGVVVYEGDALGPAYRGMLLSAEAGRNVIYAYHPKPDGAGFQLDRERLISSVPEDNANYVWNDRAQNTRKWFRPSDIAVGPDGALYIADWYDPVVGGHQMDDTVGYGRIYRVTPKGKTLQTPKLDLSTTEGQIEALKSPAVNARALGFAGLSAQGPAALDAVEALLEAPNPYHRARAIWLLAQLGEPGVTQVEALLEGPDPDVRLTAFRALRSVEPDVLEAAQMLAQDSSAAVRREVAVALRDVPMEASQDLILELARRYDGQDRYYLEALGLAADGKEEALYPLLRAELGDDPAAWDDRFAGIAWRLHPLAALEDLQTRAASPDVTEAARKQAITAIGFIQDVRAANTMAALTQSALPDVAEGAAWWLRYRTTNDWRDYEIEGWSGAVAATVSEDQTEMIRLREIVTDTTAWVDVRAEAAFEMAQDPLGGSLLLGLIAAEQLPYQVQSSVRSALLTNPNPTQRQMASALFSRSDASEPDSADWSTSALARLAADPAEGEMLFWANCAACHRLGEIGNDVGPELTAIRGKFDQAGLIEAIVHPSAAVAHGYEPQLVTTEDGRAIYGFLVADGPMLVLKDQTGQQQTVEKSAVTTQTTFEASLMPDPATLRLTPQSVADIAAFLMAQE